MRVVAYFLHRIQPDGRLTVRASTIGQEVNLSEQAVYRNIRAIRARGWLISRQLGRNRANAYRLASDPELVKVIRNLRRMRKERRERRYEDHSGMVASDKSTMTGRRPG